MSYEFAKKEIGDYRITIYQDEDAECPCTEWDLAGVYFWDYSDYGYNRGLSRGCSSEVDAKNAEDALKELVCKYVSQKKIIEYINSENVDSFRMRYDKSEHMWYLENLYKGEWYNHEEFCPSDLKRFDYSYVPRSQMKTTLLPNEVHEEVSVYSTRLVSTRYVW